ncbi:MAG: hypothetical protein F4Y25_06880 [Chloroflexi bacterium]|nr:hypothetical protein [Chloroflexota bacterium]
MFKIGFQAGGVNGVDQPSALQGAYRTCIVRAPILDTDANSSASRNDIATRARNACISLPTGFGERALREARELLETLSDSELEVYPGPIADALRSARRAIELPVGGSTIAMEALDVATALC